MAELLAHEIVGKRIREIRTEKSLTIEALAKKIGISRSYLNYLELGRKNISVDKLDVIARSLEVPMTDLVKRED